MYPKELSPDLITSVVFEFYQKSNKVSKKAFLAVDVRESSLKIAALIKKLYPDYFDYIGILPTPVFYWLVLTKKIPGIMVTASHLPKKYNGLKIFFPSGHIWLPNRIKAKSPKNKYPKEKLEKLINNNVYQEYFNYLAKFIQHSKIKINLFKNHPFTPILQKFFPIINLQPNKSPFQFKTDLDSDRLILYYNKSKILPDIIFTKIALQSDYQKLAAPITMSHKLAKLIKDSGKSLTFVKTGHRYFKETYLKKKIEFAFEPSGHFYFFRELKTESPFLALRKYLEIFDNQDLQLQKSLKHFQINLKLQNRIDLAKLVKKLVQELKPEKIKKFDGYLLQEKENWCHIRLSKTEPKLRIFGEGEIKFKQKYLHKIKIWLSKN